MRGSCYRLAMATRDGAARVRALLEGPPLTWLMIGDSITQAHNCTDGRRGYADLFAEHLRGRLLPDRSRDAIVNTGVSGSTVVDCLSEFHWRVGRFSPDVVSILFGANDAGAGIGEVGHFGFDLDQLVRRSLDLGAAVILHTPYPVAPYGDREYAMSLAAYAEAVRRVGTQQGLLVVDHFAHWQSRPESARWYLDDIHANPRGHAEMARVMFDTLGRAADIQWLDELAATLQPS